MESTELRNAHSVLESWRRGEHTNAWTPKAQSLPPSVTVLATVAAHRSVLCAADAAADSLIEAGFLPGHPSVMAMRTLASQQAAAANRQARWADALAAAEAAGS